MFSIWGKHLSIWFLQSPFTDFYLYLCDICTWDLNLILCTLGYRYPFSRERFNLLIYLNLIQSFVFRLKIYTIDKVVMYIDYVDQHFNLLFYVDDF